MNILVVSHDSNFSGGANRSLYGNIVELINKYDSNLTVLVPSKTGSFVDALRKLNVRIIYSKYYGVMSTYKHDGKDFLRLLKVHLGFYNEFLRARFIYRKLKKQNLQFDLVYTNTRLPIIGAYIAKFLGIPHILHPRELGGDKNIYGKWNFKRINKMCDCLICISNSLKLHFVEGGVDPEKVIVSYNGIDYSPIPFSAKQILNEVNICITGRIVPDKGHLDIIHALNYIKITNPSLDKKLSLYIVGSEPSFFRRGGYLNKLKSEIKKLSLLDNVIFTGEINDMHKIREKMHIEVVCSTNETFGRVTIEGMRDGLLVIGTNSGGTKELITNNVNGFLYNPGDFKTLAEIIVYVLNNQDDYDRVRMNGYKFSSSNFTVSKNCSEIYDVFRKILNK